MFVNDSGLVTLRNVSVKHKYFQSENLAMASTQASVFRAAVLLCGCCYTFCYTDLAITPPPPPWRLPGSSVKQSSNCPNLLYRPTYLPLCHMGGCGMRSGGSLTYVVVTLPSSLPPLRNLTTGNDIQYTKETLVRSTPTIHRGWILTSPLRRVPPRGERKTEKNSTK